VLGSSTLCRGVTQARRGFKSGDTCLASELLYALHLKQLRQVRRVPIAQPHRCSEAARALSTGPSQVPPVTTRNSSRQTCSADLYDSSSDLNAAAAVRGPRNAGMPITMHKQPRPVHGGDAETGKATTRPCRSANGPLVAENECKGERSALLREPSPHPGWVLDPGLDQTGVGRKPAQSCMQSHRLQAIRGGGDRAATATRPRKPAKGGASGRLRPLSSRRFTGTNRRVASAPSSRLAS
jgi:hypothetical protein